MHVSSTRASPLFEFQIKNKRFFCLLAFVKPLKCTPKPWVVLEMYIFWDLKSLSSILGSMVCWNIYEMSPVVTI